MPRAITTPLLRPTIFELQRLSNTLQRALNFNLDQSDSAPAIDTRPWLNGVPLFPVNHNLFIGYWAERILRCRLHRPRPKRI